MRSRQLLAIPILTALLSSQFCSAENFKEEPFESALEGLLKEKERGTNGALLRLEKVETAEVDPKNADRRITLTLHWSIEYKGKRWPFVILEPSREREIWTQTKFSVFAKGQSGKHYAVLLFAPRPSMPQASEKDSFLELPKGRLPAAGTVRIDLAQPKRKLIKLLPKEFSPDVTPEIHVLLYHEPLDRGEHLTLDSWIGELATLPKRVSVKRW